MFVLLGNHGRSPRRAGLVVFALACAGSYLWSLRPLSETERTLVGTWACNTDTRIQLRLDPDRRAFLRAPARGSRPPHPAAEPAEELEFFGIGSWFASKASLVVWNGRSRSWISSWFRERSTSENERRASVGGWSGQNPSRSLRVLDADYMKLGTDLYFRVQASVPLDRGGVARWVAQ